MAWVMAAWLVGSDVLHWAADRLAPRLGVDGHRAGRAAVAVCFGVALVVVFVSPDLWAYRAGLAVLAWAVCFPRSWEEWILAAPRRLRAATAAINAVRD